MRTLQNVSANPDASNAVAARANCLADRLSLTLQHASEITGISIATLRRHEQAGRLRFLKVGGRTLVEARSLEAMLFGQPN